MSDVIRSVYQAASGEMIAKLIKAGYLQPALRHDADAITLAIAKMKQELRGGGGCPGGLSSWSILMGLAENGPVWFVLQ